MSSSEAELLAQRAANTSSAPYYETFREHREHMTGLVCGVAEEGSAKRLCVLGAGNCNDLDIEQVSRHYAEIHLVDIDESALGRAVARQSETVRSRLVCHAPVDISGAFDRFERWARGDANVEELMSIAGDTAEALHALLGGAFDTVLSACVLTQIQLAALHVLGDTHRWFEAVRHTLAVTHLRSLARLTAPRGRAILATDVSASRIFPFKSLLKGARRFSILDQLVTAGHIFYVANPSWLAAITRDDPVLRQQVRATPPLDVWSWQNGPNELFLVYALELEPIGK